MRDMQQVASSRQVGSIRRRTPFQHEATLSANTETLLLVERDLQRKDECQGRYAEGYMIVDDRSQAPFSRREANSTHIRTR